VLTPLSPPYLFAHTQQQGPSLQPSYYFYDELLLGPSGRTPSILGAHAAAHLLLSHVDEARSDVEVALALPATSEAAGTHVDLLGVMSAVQGVKAGADEGSVKELRERYPDHPLVKDLEKREAAFDAAAEKFAIAA
jgi:coatomer protein complex subunit epsilon